MDIRVGDTLVMKKKHPCGSNRWLVERVGADFRLKCLGCGRAVFGPRAKFEQRVSAGERPGAAGENSGKNAGTFRPPHSLKGRAAVIRAKTVPQGE